MIRHPRNGRARMRQHAPATYTRALRSARNPRADRLRARPGLVRLGSGPYHPNTQTYTYDAIGFLDAPYATNDEGTAPLGNIKRATCCGRASARWSLLSLHSSVSHPFKCHCCAACNMNAIEFTSWCSSSVFTERWYDVQYSYTYYTWISFRASSFT